jgi:hypothetical protein
MTVSNAAHPKECGPQGTYANGWEDNGLDDGQVSDFNMLNDVVSQKSIGVCLGGLGLIGEVSTTTLWSKDG